jgi:hypothetical protein
MRTKEKLIEKILHIDDESVLEDIMEMVDLELDLVGEEVKLADEQKSFIDEGLKDIEEDNLISNEEVKRRSKEWLKNK